MRGDGVHGWVGEWWKASNHEPPVYPGRREELLISAFTSKTLNKRSSHFRPFAELPGFFLERFSVKTNHKCFDFLKDTLIIYKVTAIQTTNNKTYLSGPSQDFVKADRLRSITKMTANLYR